jgi:hypothetical protein
MMRSKRVAKDCVIKVTNKKRAAGPLKWFAVTFKENKKYSAVTRTIEVQTDTENNAKELILLTYGGNKAIEIVIVEEKNQDASNESNESRTTDERPDADGCATANNRPKVVLAAQDSGDKQPPES